MSNEFDYEEKQHDDRSFEGAFSRILKTLKKDLRVQFAAKIIKVNSQDSVNIEYYSNGVADILQNVPVRHLKSPTGFFILKLKVGDRGVVRFFDDDIDLYRTSGVVAESSEVKVHDINDNIFEIGFYPDNENYIYPDGDLVIGTKAGALISLTENKINISGGDIAITGSNVNIGNNTTIDGKVFLEHVHSNGNQGANTGPVV
ncbi:MAG: hypothetical protein ACI37Q_04290 [Candidatus Gastranaerophilaceae bacterium]